MAQNTSEALAKAEYGALKQEILMRIAIQNITILAAVALFSICMILGLVFADQAGSFVLIQSCGTLALALQWCHQGVRQCALKRAVMAADKAAGRVETWEKSLPLQRPAGLLGSRWFVSTKGVFIGLNLVSVAWVFSTGGLVWLMSCAALLLTSGMLVTNPKE